MLRLSKDNISYPSFFANFIAKSLLPLAVGPIMANKFFLF